MLENLINIQYCYDYLINQISPGLLLYSHIPTALVAIIFGSFLLSKSRKLSNVTLFLVCILFAIWCFLDLSAWFSFFGSSITMFTWSLVDLIGLFFFFFSYYFLYSFLKERDMPIWQKICGLVIIAPTFIATFLGMNLINFDLNYCEAGENTLITNYLFIAEIIFLLSVVFLTISHYFKTKDKRIRKETFFSGLGVSLFLFFFFFTTFLASYLADHDIWVNAYNVEIYGLFGMPILLVFLGYLVVKYRAFDLKVFTAQALVVTLITLVAAQFAFIHDITSILLNTLTFVLVSWAGVSLSRNVKKEIELRQKNEILAKNLQVANEGQATLIHFINHQIKGYLSKGRSIYAEMLGDDDYGPLNDSAKEMLKTGEESLKEGVEFVQDILKSSDIDKGTMSYNMEHLDFRKIVTDMAEDQKKFATDKGLQYEVDIKDANYEMRGDINQLKEAVRNLINNSISYTPKGSINISLSKDGNKIRFSIKDTGVGLSDELKPKLFTKGGTDKDSRKINVNSTGFGLSIVKGIVDAHHGKVWAESEGPGKGSTFSMELPVA